MSRVRANLSLAGLLILLSCGGGGELGLRRTGTRAVVIGIDGADWTIIEALAAEGEMQNLMSLRKRGTWGPIETLRDIPQNELRVPLEGVSEPSTAWSFKGDDVARL